MGGFSYAGSEHSAETLVEKSRDLLPAAIVTKPHRSWLFFASEAAALDAVIARFDHPANGPALGGDPAFQQAVKALGVAQDLVVYAHGPALAAWPGAPKTAALATQLQKGKLHDTIFLPAPPAAPVKNSQRTLALTSTQTLLYATGNFAALPGAADFLPLQTLLPQLGAAGHALEAKGLGWNDLGVAFEPELGAVVEWPEESALPVVAIAAPVRDAAKARQILDAITTAGPLGLWTAEPQPAAMTYTAPAGGFPLLRPALALTEQTALLGLTPEALHTMLPRLAQPAAPLTESPAFHEATRLLPSSPATFVYLDFQRLFERGYRLARPFITLSLAFSPESAAQIDAGKLPPVDSIARHLGPLLVTQTRVDSGLLIETTGSITFTDLLIASLLYPRMADRR